MKKIKVTFHSTHCPKCNVLEKKLLQKGIAYTENNDVNIIQSLGVMEVPVLEVDGKVLRYAEAVEWVSNYNLS